MKHRITLLLMLTLCACTQRPAVLGTWDIVPAPREVSAAAGEGFLLSRQTVITPGSGLEGAAALLSELLEPAAQRRIPVRRGAHAIVLQLDSALGVGLEPFRREECYRIDVSKRRITVTATTVLGALRGVQTLVKLFPPAVQPGETAAAAPGTLFDYPEFAYRAFLLDCGRHFFPVATVKKVIDILSLHQVNQFHWHLTEDQGWRLEIKRYPRLTEVGSWRAGSPVPGEKGHDGVPVSGFYTQDEAREIVAYAAERGINVIPEIDMPGHMKAALASYPALGCTGGPYEVACEYGVLDDVLCAGKDSTMAFVRGVLDEIMDIFPSPYIHLGGDECPKVRWESCPHCQARIRELGLKGDGAKTAEELLQSWFMDRVAEYVEARGRRVIAWNDVLVGWDNRVSGAPSKNTVIAGWMRNVSTEIAVREGYDAILCPIGHTYLSAADGNRLTGEPYIRRVYDLNVVPQTLTPQERARILGVEACIWTERVDNEDLLLWELLPRLGAVSELQWSAPSSRSYDAFLPRLHTMEHIYTARGWNWNRWDR
ncbi:MAG: beta-N-acetylhexosaminidase [Bacteroidales bacterium]|nr:beta-N-acetylhexosaminidase [Bacteroidales bacterium]